MDMIKNIMARIVAFLVVGCVTVSCTKENGISFPPAPVDIDIDTRAIPASHTCSLYIFKNNVCSQIVALPSGVASITLDESELVSGNTFRFLYISQPASISNGVTVRKSPSGAVATGTNLTDVRIEAQAQELSDAIYCKVDTYSGNALGAISTITATLPRLVGQQIIDIFKVENGTLTTPLDVDPLVATSVLDRVTSIALTYSGLTKVIGFNADGTIKEFEQWPGSHSLAVKTLTLNQTPGSTLLHATLPQTAIGIEQVKNASNVVIGGSARIKGIWGLPATNKVKVVAKFSYYHTTPLRCSEANPSEHTHTVSCFQLKDKNSGEETGDPNIALFLNLPKLNSTPISIVPNVYTVSKAGLDYDRVIDVGVNGGFGFETDWANGDLP
ncbi:DUF5031 domain-containing protein [Alistipes sp. OttesenSCG-928-B03]|nr:DUF5031 domain-containing protein [Alistipes sp. OttesenSCG-928-B03]